MDLKTLAELPKLIETMKQESLNCTKELVSSQQFLSSKFEEIVQSLKILSDEVQHLRAENDQLRCSIKTLSLNAKSISNAVQNTERDLESQCRAQLASNAIVVGLPRCPQEDTADLVLKLCDSIGYKHAKNEIVSCNRVANQTAGSSPIKITFKSKYGKECLMEHKKNYGPLNSTMIKGAEWPRGKAGKVFIRDDLTPITMRLFQELKELQGTLKLRYVWPGRDGAIMVRKSDNSKAIPIHSRQDLHKLQTFGQN